MIKFIKQHSNPLRHQKGAALILLFLAILMTGTVVFVTSISMNRSRIQSDVQTMQSLAKAKEALIAFASTFYNRTSVAGNPWRGLYGFLPCANTDMNGEGQTDPNCDGSYENILGRFPWQTLGTDVLKDSSGNCLWYAVSGEYKQGTNLTRSELHNEDSPGFFEVYDENGNLLNGGTPENRVVAVVIAPGAALPGQNRGIPNQNNPCDFPSDSANPADFLDNFAGFDNSGIVTNTEDEVYRLVTLTGLSVNGLNDRIITITADEIFNAFRRQAVFNTNLETLTNDLAQCISRYGNDMRVAAGGGGVINLPWAADVDLNGADYRDTDNYIDRSNNFFGRFPFDIINSHPNIPSGSTAYGGSLFNHCITPVVGLANDMLELDFEFRRLYEHWKDHYFYAVSRDFAPGGDGNCMPAANCITYDVGGTNIRISAILFYANVRNNQLRRAEPPGNPVNDASSKGVITNYLESGTYPTFNSTGNDFAVCVDLSNRVCQCEGLVTGTGLCPL